MNALQVFKHYVFGDATSPFIAFVPEPMGTGVPNWETFS